MIFEHEIKTAPNGSDRLCSYKTAAGVIAALNGIEEVLSSIYVQMGRDRAIANQMTTADNTSVGGVAIGDAFEFPDLEGSKVVKEASSQLELPLDPPADAFPRFDSGETFEEAQDDDHAFAVGTTHAAHIARQTFTTEDGE